MKNFNTKHTLKILLGIAVFLIIVGGLLYLFMSINTNTQSMEEEREVLSSMCAQHNYLEVPLAITRYKNWKGDIGGYFIELPGGIPGWGGTLYNAKGEKLGNIDSLPPEYSETKETEGLLLKMKMDFPFKSKLSCPTPPSHEVESKDMTPNDESTTEKSADSKDIYINAFLARQELLKSGDIGKIRAHMMTAASSPEARAKFEGMSDEEWKTAIPYVLNAPLTKETLLAPDTEWDIQDTVVKVRIRISESDTLMSELRKVDGIWY